MFCLVGIYCKHIIDPTVSPTPNPTSLPTSPPTMKYFFNGTKYIGVYAPSGINWYNALSYCQSEFGTSLASIHSENDQIAASDATYAATPFSVESESFLAWIGLNDYFDNDGTFSWSDGTSFNYNYWGSGEPNSASGHCVTIQGLTSTRYPLTNGVNGPWNDWSCSNTPYAFVCNSNVTGMLMIEWMVFFVAFGLLVLCFLLFCSILCCVLFLLFLVDTLCMFFCVFGLCCFFVFFSQQQRFTNINAFQITKLRIFICAN